MNREQAREYIKQNIPCTDYLERSKNNMYCCPYPDCNSGHGANGTGAVKYYPNTNTWTCHACGRGHDVIDAYMQANGCDHNTALSYLAARAGIEIDSRPTAAQDFAQTPVERPTSAENANKDKASASTAKQPQNANNSPADYTQYYAACLERITDPAAVSYLEARGITTYTAAACGIGYDPAADPAGAPGAMGNEYKAHPAPRIIIPCSKSHYVARSIDPNTPPAFKAMNPNTAKGGGKVALFNTAALYAGADVVFITEGAFDALSFLEAGQQAIALNSKGNGKLLVEQLKARGTTSAFIICHDNDDDPKTAADTMQRAEELQQDLTALDLQAIVYNVAGQAHDANDMLQADPETFKQNIAAAIQELQTPHDELTAFLEKIQTEAYRPNRTGLNFFDDLTGGGIVNQSLLLLMAAPGAGKTTLAQQLAEAIAKDKRPVLYFNFEMSTEQMLAKAISAKAYKYGVDKTALQILQGYKWTDDDRRNIEAAIEDYRQNNYPYIRYNPPGTTNEINGLLKYLDRTGAAAVERGQQAPAAIVDYLHLITSSDKLDAQELIKQTVKGLKQYAVKYNTFVIGISATNRDSNKHGRITLESGRDSSNIEYTGDYVISLNYDDIDSGKVKASDVEAIAELQQAKRRVMILRVLKSRFFMPGKSVKTMFDAAHNMFYGTADEFIPAAGFTTDDGLPAWDDDSDVIATI